MQIDKAKTNTPEKEREGKTAGSRKEKSLELPHP